MSATSSRLISGLVVSLCIIAIGVASRNSCPLIAREINPTQSADEGKDAESRLDAVLGEWRKAEKATPDRHYSFTRTDNLVTFGSKKVVRGEVFVHKPNLLCVDEKDPKGTTTSVLLCTGKSIRLYQFAQKSVLSGELPEIFGFPEKPERYPDGILNECIGIAFQQLAWTFIGTLANERTGHVRFALQKEDKDWIYLTIEPRKRSRRLDFDAPRVALDASSYRVRQFWVPRSSGDTSTWDFGVEDIDNKVVTTDSISKGLPDDFENVPFPPSKAKKDSGKP